VDFYSRVLYSNDLSFGLSEMKKRGLKKWKRRGCEGKTKHATFQGAQIALDHFLRRRRKSGNQIVSYMDVYRCQFCGSFHTGRRGINWSL